MADDLAKVEATAAAILAWHEMTDDQKALVRFGMIPVEIADKYTPQVIASPVDAARLFTVAVMNCAERDGGMVA